MKGITPVIAIILLLLITVAMVGFAMVWFQKFVAMTGSQTEENLQTQLDQQSKTIHIANIDNTNGITTIVTVIVPGATIDCTLDVLCDGNKALKITAPGNFDETKCTT